MVELGVLGLAEVEGGAVEQDTLLEGEVAF